MPSPREIADAARRHLPDMLRFLREMIAIPSESAEEREVVQCVRREMESAGFDEIKIDGMGNILGRIGSGKTTIVLDGHLDTVGIGDRSTWSRDPYAGDIENGVLYGRGASDQEAGIAAAVYGAKIIKELGLLGDYQLWVTGTVMEEDCDGLCWKYILSEGELKPDVVVITEPTNLNVYRGHRGRMEIEVRTQGRSCHGSAPERGVNAIYKMAPIIADIEKLNESLAESADAFLGKGTVTIAQIRSTSPSLCAVADSATIHLDRRLTRGETLESALLQIQNLPSVIAAGASVSVLHYKRTAYTGTTVEMQKYYPSWVFEPGHPAIIAAQNAGREALDREPLVGKWVFSTNGVATAGLFGIPTVGFGPADEIFAHTPDDQCPVEHLVHAARFYAAFPQHFMEAIQK